MKADELLSAGGSAEARNLPGGRGRLSAPARPFRGAALGAVTASYALGSILFARVFAWRIDTVAVEAALQAVGTGGFAAATDVVSCSCPRRGPRSRP